MDAIVNRLKAQLDLPALDSRFDFFRLTTTDKFIPSMAYVLDKPVEKIKALSLAYEPKTKSAFAMFKKGMIGRRELEEALEDPNIFVASIGVAELQPHFILRLLLSALGNYSDEFQFNNVNGRLFLTNPKWVWGNKIAFTACEFKVDKDLVFTAHAVSFSSVAMFAPKKIASLPRYSFGGAHGTLIRALASDPDAKVYVPKAPPGGNKASLDFLRFDEKGKKYKETRAYLMYRILSIFNATYEGAAFAEFEKWPIKAVEDTPSDKRFMDGVLMDLRLKGLNLVNLCGAEEEADTFDDMVKLVSSVLPCTVSDSVDPNVPNIVFLHDKEYYGGVDDPYDSFDKSAVIQAATVEDAGRAVGEYLAELKPGEERKCPVINTILKELAIKQNLRDRALTMDDWPSRGYSGNYVFGTLYEGRLYYLTVSPDGCLSYINKDDDFSPFFERNLQDLTEDLEESLLKGKFIVQDDRGNVNVIGRTELITLPAPDIFEAHEIRGKAKRPIYLSGVVDINFYDTADGMFFNAGPQGSGMARKLPKASRMYRVEVVRGEEIVSRLLPLMAVAFVKYGDYTVLPYPFKYLREYIDISKPKEKK